SIRTPNCACRADDSLRRAGRKERKLEDTYTGTSYKNVSGCCPDRSNTPLHPRHGCLRFPSVQRDAPSGWDPFYSTVREQNRYIDAGLRRQPARPRSSDRPWTGLDRGGSNPTPCRWDYNPLAPFPRLSHCGNDPITSNEPSVFWILRAFFLLESLLDFSLNSSEALIAPHPASSKCQMPISVDSEKTSHQRHVLSTSREKEMTRAESSDALVAPLCYDLA